jgi:LmbE family N-acetylglucosaminyl deacetylase
MTRAARACLEATARLVRRPMPEAELALPALAVAPHPDDEALGAGGTIARKLRAGARVDVVFLTDGRESHGRYLPAEELAARREAEARVAGAALGLSDANLHFLRLPDQSLAAAPDLAIDRLRALLDALRPEQLFVPYRGETPPDHHAGRACALVAARATGRACTVLEYPVWFWAHWPWAFVSKPGLRPRATAIARGLVAPWRWLADLRCSVDIAGVLDAKRRALACYATQTQRLGAPDWPILADVDRGRWLACFFRDDEIFRRWRLSGRSREARPARSGRGGEHRSSPALPSRPLADR